MASLFRVQNFGVLAIIFQFTATITFTIVRVHILCLKCCHDTPSIVILLLRVPFRDHYTSQILEVHFLQPQAQQSNFHIWLADWYFSLPNHLLKTSKTMHIRPLSIVLAGVLVSRIDSAGSPHFCSIGYNDLAGDQKLRHITRPKA